LIVDYGGMGLGVLNAMWPRLKSSDLAPSPPLLTTRTNGDGDETSSTPSLPQRQDGSLRPNRDVELGEDGADVVAHRSSAS
jgi:hypothetical protein